MPTTRNPLMIRAWALLYYLSKNRDTPDECKVFAITSYMRSNWKATKQLLEYAVSQKWIEPIESGRHFRITKDGEVCLEDLRRGLQRIHLEEMRVFIGRVGQRDQPK